MPGTETQAFSPVLPASVRLSRSCGSSSTVFGLAPGVAVTVSPLRSLSAMVMPAPPTEAVLVTAAPLRPGKPVGSRSWATKAPMSASAIGTNGLFAALIASTICAPMPDAQMPWILSYWPLWMKSLASWVVFAGSQPVNTPSAFGTTLMFGYCLRTVSYTHLRAHETRHDLVCRLLLEKKKKNQTY